MITRTEIDLLADGLITIDELANQKLHDLLELLFLSERSLEEIRDTLIQDMAALADFYAQASGAHAAQWYDMLREQEAVASTYWAQVPEVVDVQNLTRDIRRDMRFAFAGDPEATRQALKDTLSRQVRSASRKTLVHNLDRDPAKPAWARVPKGQETCAFCHIMASRGFIYSSPKAAGQGAANRFHRSCDCAIVPIWDKHKVKIEGYDPDIFKARYDAALESLEEKFPPQLGVTFDERWLVREMNILFPEVYGFKGARAGDIPFSQRKNLPFTDDLARHVWEGDERGGGHAYGLGKPEKTEFPQDWDVEKIKRVTRELLFYGKVKFHNGNPHYYKLEGISSDVLVRIWVRDDSIGTIHPLRGQDVFKNSPDGNKEPQGLSEKTKRKYNQMLWN